MVYIGTPVPRYLCRRSMFEKLCRDLAEDFSLLALLHFHQAHGWAHCCSHHPLQHLHPHSSYISAATAETNPWFRTDLFKPGHWKASPVSAMPEKKLKCMETVRWWGTSPAAVSGTGAWLGDTLPDSQLQFPWLLVTATLNWSLFCLIHCSNAASHMKK